MTDLAGWIACIYFIILQIALLNRTEKVCDQYKIDKKRYLPLSDEADLNQVSFGNILILCL